MNRNLGRLVLLTAGIIWGFGFIVNDYILESGWDDSQLLFVRFFTAFVFMFLIFFKRIIKADKETLKKGLLLGVFLFLGFFFQTWGLEETSASNNALITAGYIVFLPLIIYIFERKLVHKQTLIAALVTFVGIIVISVDFNALGNINRGDVNTFIGAIFWGFHIYLLGKHAKQKDPIVLMAFQLLVVSILAFIAMLLRQETSLVNMINFHEWDSLKILIAAVVIGFFASFVAFTLQSIGQKHSNPTEAAILISTESVFGPILAVLILHEALKWQLVLGIILVFSGVILSEIDVLAVIRNRKTKKTKK